MAKQYRLHQGQPGSGWFSSTRISPDKINDVSSGNLNSKKIATSIPSPFARIDLVKTAFRDVANTTIYGNSNSHKLVSDALDVAQLFFNFKNVKNKYPNAEIIAWDPGADLNKLLSNKQNEAFGETVQLFWKQDGEVYNFNKVQRLFILKINFKVVGATSPSTMFFAAPDVDQDNVDFQIANVAFFDSNYESLIEREDELIRFMYAFAKQDEFTINFKEVYDYLQLCLEELQRDKPELWNEVNAYTRASLLQRFEPLEIGAGNIVEVLGTPICKAVSNTGLIESRSGFTIKATQEINELKPLVLPTDPFHQNWIYTSAPWDPNIQVPDIDANQLEYRTLPSQGDQYPFLTKGDFFEDSLIKTSFSLNDEKFHSLGFKKHLIPLKPLFFKYFTVYDLVNEKMLSVNESVAGGGVNVKLSIPTRSGTITYSKTYTAENIFTRDFYCGIYPLLKSENNDFPIEYHIGLIDREANNELQMRFWETGQNTSVQNLNKRDRVKKDQSEFGGSKNYHISETFDYIKVFDNLNIRGMIIPKFKKTAPGAQRCSVSVDFGTTNTHIEYRYEEAIEKAFEVTDIFGSLTHSSDVKKGLNIVAERILTSELYPSEIGTEGICSFPLRSALLENGDTVQNNATQSFLDSNIAYYYERIGKTPHHTIKTDFKWGNMNDTVLKNRIQQFIEQLVEGIKNKLLLDNVSPRNMFITWLYPVSMTKFQRNSLALLWNEVIEKKIGSVIELRSMPESIAPFIFHVKNTGLVGLTASIDIGGGSSDISIYEEDKPQIISSIKFAGNAIVGDGYNNSVRNNGFVRTFGDLFESRCNEKGNSEYPEILKQIVKGSSPSSSNFSSFLFSVPKDVFNYANEITNNGRLKFLYIVFYAAKAYYLAKLMHMKGLSFPKNIIFSGTGSKSIQIIDNTPDLEILRNLFEFIFSKVYGEKASRIEIIPSEQPKEITCKGALADEESYDKVPVGFWMGGTRTEFDLILDIADDKIITYDDISKNSDLEEDIISSVELFYDIVDEYLRNNDMEDLFGVDYDVIKIFKENRSESLLEYLKMGLDKKVKESGTLDKPISESLFFYPLIGALNSLGVKLSKS